MPSEDFWAEIKNEEDETPKLNRQESSQSVDFWGEISNKEGQTVARNTDKPKDEDAQSVDFWTELEEADEKTEAKSTEKSSPAAEEPVVDFWSEIATDDTVTSKRPKIEDQESNDFWADVEGDKEKVKVKSPVVEVNEDIEDIGADRPSTPPPRNVSPFLERSRNDVMDEERASRSPPPFPGAKATRPMTLPLGGSKPGNSGARHTDGSASESTGTVSGQPQTRLPFQTVEHPAINPRTEF